MPHSGLFKPFSFGKKDSSVKNCWTKKEGPIEKCSDWSRLGDSKSACLASIFINLPFRKLEKTRMKKNQYFNYEIFCLLNDFKKEQTTMPRRNMNLLYSIRMYWTNFWQPTVQVQQDIFEKTLNEVDSSYLHASFGSFCVKIV